MRPVASPRTEDPSPGDRWIAPLFQDIKSEETHTVSPDVFQAALDQFGAQHLVELTQLVGHYTQTAFFLNAFAVELPSDRSEKVLPV